MNDDYVSLEESAEASGCAFIVGLVIGAIAMLLYVALTGAIA